MANTLTNLVKTIRIARDNVSREQIGFLPAVTLDPALGRSAAKDQTIRIPITPASSAADITAGQQAPDTGDQTMTSVTLSISKSRAVPIRWNGEEQLSMNNSLEGGLSPFFGQQLEQAMRDLCNEKEADVAGLYAKASRAAGPNGTNLFDSTGKLKDIASVMQILRDNGAPMGDVSLVIGGDEYVNMQGLTQLTNVNEYGDRRFQQQAAFTTPLLGANVYHSPEVDVVTAGTGSSATTDNAGYAVGATTITLASAGTGTILAGDTITFAGDTNKYVVTTGDSDVSDGGTIVLAEPGLKVAIAASTTAITVDSSSRNNMCFARSAIMLVQRAPAVPEGGDMASDRTMITDPKSGLSFELAVYPEYRQNHYSVGSAWGFEMIKPEHAALLID